jgi:hypothetical protein
MNQPRVHRKDSGWPGVNFLESLIDPIDQLSEAIFSILIFMTYVLAFWIFRISGDSSQPVSQQELKELLLGVLGAIVAWGIIDGIMYAFLSAFERGERNRLLCVIRCRISLGHLYPGESMENGRIARVGGDCPGDHCRLAGRVDINMPVRLNGIIAAPTRNQPRRRQRQRQGGHDLLLRAGVLDTHGEARQRALQTGEPGDPGKSGDGRALLGKKWSQFELFPADCWRPDPTKSSHNSSVSPVKNSQDKINYNCWWDLCVCL